MKRLKFLDVFSRYYWINLIYSAVSVYTILGMYVYDGKFLGYVFFFAYFLLFIFNGMMIQALFEKR